MEPYLKTDVKSLRVPLCQNLVHFGPQTADITLLSFNFPLQLFHSVTGDHHITTIHIAILVFSVLRGLSQGHKTM